MAKQWYALHSHPHKEDLLWRQIEANAIEGYYPCIRVTPVNPRSRKVRPYFPGYVFVYTDLEALGLSRFNYMPYATGLVSFGGEPAVVAESLIVSLRRRLEEIDAAGGELFDGLKPGDEIVIHDGPFAGYEALFDLRIPGSERVRVLLKMLSDRNLPLEIDSGKIRKK
jgi:transcriptional antiterminator RfaH